MNFLISVALLLFVVCDHAWCFPLDYTDSSGFFEENFTVNFENFRSLINAHTARSAEVCKVRMIQKSVTPGTEVRFFSTHDRRDQPFVVAPDDETPADSGDLALTSGESLIISINRRSLRPMESFTVSVACLSIPPI